MIKQRTLPDILNELIEDASFIIEYKFATDNGDGTYTLAGVCDIHHIQPGFFVTIGGLKYRVKDYIKVSGILTIVLEAGIHPLPAAPGSFELYKPFFFHGTPMMEEVELKKVSSLSKKTPMIYLPEPFRTKMDHTFNSSIDRRCDFTLCFLTQADIPKWLTKDFYHDAINPMNNLVQDFFSLLENSPLFYTTLQKGESTFYAKFGINIKELGTKKLYFSENLSGVGVDLRLEIYKEEHCCSMATFESA